MRPSRRSGLRLTLTVAAALTATAGTAHAAVDDTLLVSRVGLAGAPADAGSGYPGSDTATPSISRDGGKVAFVTQATNLGAGPGLYVKDMTTGALQFISPLTTSAAAGSAPSVLFLQQPRLADSGRHLCYLDAVGGQTHVVVRDLDAGGAVHDAGEAVLGAPDFHDNAQQRKFCDVTDDGTKVVFATRRALDPADTEPSSATSAAADDVYLHDFRAGTDTLVSRADGPGGVDGADGASVSPEITPDGRFVLFYSRAANLSPLDDDAAADVFQRDLQTGSTRWISRADGADGGPGAASTLNNGVNVTSGSADAAQSDDGRFVVFTSTRRDLDPAVPAVGTGSVYLRDTQQGTTRAAAVTRAPDGSPKAMQGNSNLPTITGDGRFVGLGSNGTQLDPTSATPATTFIEKEFVRDTVGNRTALVSRAPGVLGATNDGQASGAQLSGDGRFEVFASVATNLVPGDVHGPMTSFGTPTGVDVFVRTLDPDRPSVADLPGAPAVGVPQLATTLPAAPTPLQPFATPAAVKALLGTRSPARRRATAILAVASGAPVAVTIRLGEYGVVTFATDRLTTGRAVGKGARRRCVAAGGRPVPVRLRCTRAMAVATRSLAGYEGTNRFTLRAVTGRSHLARGRYRLRAVEYDLGLKTGTNERTFTVR